LRHKLSYLIFGILLIVFLFYVFMPLIEPIFPSLAELRLNIDPSSVGLAALLVFVSFALILLEKMPTSAFLSKLRLSAQGVEAEFQDLEERANEIKDLEVAPRVKEEIEFIRNSDPDPKAVFLELIIEIEKKLKLLASKYGEESWRYMSVRKIIDQLSKKGEIDSNLASIIRDFWTLRNRTIHGDIVITRDRLEDAIQIGETILSRLDKSYSK
jgi:hypothetical protein